MGRVELLDGALVVSPVPAVAHQRLVRNLARSRRQLHEGFAFDGLNVRVGRDRTMVADIVVLNKPGLDAVIIEPDPVALVVEVACPSDAWVDRLVKPEAYARAGIPTFLRVDRDHTDAALDANNYSLTPEEFVSARAVEGRLVIDKPIPADLDLAALATATRYPGP